MANIDKGMEQRVWQRVRGEEKQPAGLDLPGSIQAELMAAAAYRSLARQMGVKDAPLLQKAAQEEMAHANCLRGMYIQLTGQRPEVQAPQLEPLPTEAALRKAYAGELRSIAAYRERRNDSEFGHIFAAMLKEEEAHSRMVLELLGKMRIV